MMNNYKVEQMINDRGNGAMNQFVIYADGKVIFQSYNSIIAVVDKANKTIELGENWDYSVTTGKHRNIFFRDYVYLPDLAISAVITTKILEQAVKFVGDECYATKEEVGDISTALDAILAIQNELIGGDSE